jgi:heptosyltransferase-3
MIVRLKNIMHKALEKISKCFLERKCLAAAETLVCAPLSWLRCVFVWMGARIRNRRPVFVVMTNNMGDIVALSPVLECLGDAGESVCLVTERQYVGVARMIPSVQRVIPVTCLTEWLLISPFLPFRKINAHIPGHTCSRFGFEVKNPGVGDLSRDTYYRDGGLVHAFSRIVLGCVISRRPTLRRASGGPPEGGGRPKAERYAVVCLESKETERSLSTRASAVLLDVLRDVGMELRLVGTKVVTNEDVRVCQFESFESLAEEIEGASLFVGIDSGLAHIANAYSVKSVLLLGKYRNFDHYFPHGGPWEKETGVKVLYFERQVSELEGLDIECRRDELLRSIRQLRIDTASF